MLAYYCISHSQLKTSNPYKSQVWYHARNAVRIYKAASLRSRQSRTNFLTTIRHRIKLHNKKCTLSKCTCYVLITTMKVVLFKKVSKVLSVTSFELGFLFQRYNLLVNASALFTFYVDVSDSPPDSIYTK